MAGRLWIVNYLEPFPLDKKVERILSNTRPPGSARLVTALVEATDPQVGRLRHQNEVVNLRAVSAPLEANGCVAMNAEGIRCGKPASVPDRLWGGLVCGEHAATPEKMRHMQSARLLLDSVEGLDQQLRDLLDRLNEARAQSEQVSILTSELLLGAQAHLSSCKETLEIARANLRDALREEEAA